MVPARCDAPPEARANPNNFKIMSVRGDAIEPILSKGDRLVVDAARTHPTTGKLCALRDGRGLAVRRVEIVHGTEPVQLRFATANPNYAPFTPYTSWPLFYGQRPIGHSQNHSNGNTHHRANAPPRATPQPFSHPGRGRTPP